MSADRKPRVASSLGEQFPGDAAISKALLSVIDGPDKSRSAAALRELAAFPLDPESARKITGKAVDSVLAGEAEIGARTYRRVLAAQPSTYRDALKRQDVIAWIAGLAQARKRISSDQLSQLRNPQIFTASGNPRHLRAYLGALDALHLAHLRGE